MGKIVFMRGHNTVRMVQIASRLLEVALDGTNLMVHHSVIATLDGAFSICEPHEVRKGKVRGPFIVKAVAQVETQPVDFDTPPVIEVTIVTEHKDVVDLLRDKLNQELVGSFEETEGLTINISITLQM